MTFSTLITNVFICFKYTQLICPYILHPHSILILEQPYPAFLILLLLLRSILLYIAYTLCADLHLLPQGTLLYALQI